MSRVGAKPSAVPRTIAFYTDARARGGAEVYLTQLALGLREVGYETPLFVADWTDADTWVAHLEELGFVVTRFRHGKEFSPAVYAEASRLLRGFEFIHFNKTHPRNCLPAILAARAGGARIVATEHLALAPDSHVPFGRAIITALVRWTNRAVDRTIAVSELSRQMLIDNYAIPAGRIVSIQNGLDIGVLDVEHDVEATREKLGLAPDAVAAVLVGRMAERKGHRFALRAIPAIRSRIPMFKLVFVGEGEIEEMLRDEAQTLGVDDHVVWGGFRRDVPAVLASVDLLMLPSEDECLPFVILEAMGAR
ncbi:glycosyltransferase family 4 protein, partial [bacterium]|nr:glycosyltransferase family 4 protein [bacterium]